MKIKLGLLMMIFISSIGSTTTPAWHSDVINMSTEKLAVGYWLDKLHSSSEQNQIQTQPDAQQVLMSPQQIAQYNQQLVASNRYISDPLDMPDVLSAFALRAKLNSISKPASAGRYYADGHKLATQDYQQYQHNMQLEAIAASNPVEFALVVQRASLRTFPTYDRVFNAAMDTDLDRFQESALFPGEAVALLHTSRDGKWVLVQAYNYLAWMETNKLAIGSRDEVQAFTQASPFLVVSGDKVHSNYVPKQQISEIQLDMGVRLPLVAPQDISTLVQGQNPYASHVVWLPTRNGSGRLTLVQALISRNQDVQQGYLQFTQGNILTQAFKFLGERYGWGHDFNARDCTGFIGEVYRSFGIWMPRNSSEQGNGEYGFNQRFAKNALMADKLQAIGQLEVGDLIYIPGHVMLYLGLDQGQPYVIHDVKGLAYFDGNGRLYKGSLNGVSVTPLTPLRMSQKNSYLDRLYNIKRIR